MQSVVIYARVSSREQEQEGYSIQAQLKLLNAYATNNGLSVAREFVDVETAKTTGRKEFGEMVNFLKRSKNGRIILVEKTDRLYRNFRDAVTLEDLETEIHFVKENQVLSKNSRSQDKLTHGLHLLIAKNYSENLREEVVKGMREKAEQGIFPGLAAFGYRNNRATRDIEIHPEEAEIIRFIFETYATGKFGLSELRKMVSAKFGKKFARSYVHHILQNRFYLGFFEWQGIEYRGKHEPIISPQLFEAVQAVMHGHNRGKYGKRDIAFRGLANCAHDGCTITGEVKKEKYVYYRCSGFRGKCDLPRFTEAQMSEKLGEVLKGIQIPENIVAQIVAKLESEQVRMRNQASSERARLEQRLEAVRRRIDQAYTDKLDGKITEEFWQRKQADWQAEEQQIEMAIAGLTEAKTSDRLLDAKRILELANRAYFLYLSRKPAEHGRRSTTP